MKRNNPDLCEYDDDFSGIIDKLIKCIAMECDYWDSINLSDIPTSIDNSPRKISDIFANPSQRI